jgi:hypothetical protein
VDDVLSLLHGHATSFCLSPEERRRSDARDDALEIHVDELEDLFADPRHDAHVPTA